ncbi:ABC transporter ATP-binding protein, partial [Thermodesulfobacteriota bacterium]
HHAEKEQHEPAMLALERARLNTKALRLPDEPSGGEQQQMAIAPVVVNGPPILFAAEWTQSLESKNSRHVMKLIKRLNSEGQAIVMVGYSRANSELADRIIHVYDGGI